jgi:tRNA(Ile)-lysidine synthase
MDRREVSRRLALPHRWLGLIEQNILEKKLLCDGQKILVAVSGGLDSMILLRVLNELAFLHHWKLTVAHFNHQIRGRAANADERLVHETAQSLKIPFVAGRGNVGAVARRDGISVEMAGRKLRHEFFAATARRGHIPTIALAHHADDQVELFFLRLLRGTGGQGISGMKWANPSPADPSVRIVRPLLDQQKSALRKVARITGIPFSDDATNAEIEIERNRVRHVLIPALKKFSPAIAETVPRLMELAGADAQAIGDWAERWLASKRRAGFTKLPVAVQRRVIQLQLHAMKETPTFDLVEGLRLKSGVQIAIEDDRLLSRDAMGIIRATEVEENPFNPLHTEVLLKGASGREEIEVFYLHWKIEAKAGAKFMPESNVEYFDAERVGTRIWLRHWKPGDRFQPIGAASSCKLQDLFTNAKVPRSERHQRIVATTSKDEIFWVEGLRIGELFKLCAVPVRRLKWQWRRRLV